MSTIDWQKEVESRRDDFLKDLEGLLRIPSVRDDSKSTEDAPFGPDVKRALDYMIELGAKDGFTTKEVGNVAGHLEYGAGEELVGVLGHVDVVPVGDGWSHDPFDPILKDGKLYARGVADDKGPTIAGYYALKIIKELGLPISRRIRIIVGSDEESGMSCVERYFETEEQPTVAFVPDAEFPIIHAEKGISELDVSFKGGEKDGAADFRLISFESGERYNMVPDHARVVLEDVKDVDKLEKAFADFLQNHDVTGEIETEGTQATISVVGKSAHAMEPNNGINAGLHLVAFLGGFELTGAAKDFVAFGRDYLFGDSRAVKLGINYEDKESGELTMNVGVIRYSVSEGGRYGLNFRYPVTADMDKLKNKAETVVLEYNAEYSHYNDSKPLFVPQDHPLIQILQEVYTKHTGEEATLLSIGGGTYARHLETGVAFGALFPGREDTMHQKDEFSYFDDLLKATAIYAEALYKLAK
ncbi:dipeptidase PepV [Listeria costaricensis]|uniref:dipeptidase PepV n=1 Tax=Listeria costaricensis TaxID=2026604 RepID=UPI000C07D3EB|nr:dipeptidase PepV [Listeria costaricensis]